MQHFGRFLREFLADRGLTVTGAAQASGLSLSGLKRALARPDVSLREQSLAKLAVACGLSREMLLRLYNSQDAAGPGPADGATDVEYLGRVGPFVPVVRELAMPQGPLRAAEIRSGRFAACLEARDVQSLAVEIEEWHNVPAWLPADLLFLVPRWSGAVHEIDEGKWVDGSVGMLEVLDGASAWRRYLGSIGRDREGLVVQRANREYGPVHVRGDGRVALWLAVALQRRLGEPGTRKREMLDISASH